MHDWRSLSHVRWECKYHVVIVPKYRHKVFYGKMRSRIGPLLRDLCRQRGVDLLEGHSMPDHIHLCLSIPPKFSVAHTIGFLKGEGQECGASPSGVDGASPDDGVAFLGDWLLCQHGRFGRSQGAGVHSAARAA